MKPAQIFNGIGFLADRHTSGKKACNEFDRIAIGNIGPFVQEIVLQGRKHAAFFCFGKETSILFEISQKDFEEKI